VPANEFSNIPTNEPSYENSVNLQKKNGILTLRWSVLMRFRKQVLRFRKRKRSLLTEMMLWFITKLVRFDHLLS
jgi:hypothetical protein